MHLPSLVPSRALRAAAVLCLVAAASVAQEGGSPAPAADAKKFGPFTVVTECDRLPVLNQGSTGTCWSFATTSFLETEAKRLHGKDVDLSEIWWARCAVVEKARRYVRAGGKATFGEGGLGHDLTELMKDYGAMPQSAYTGLPEGQKAHNHGELFVVLTGALKALTGQDKPGAESRPAKKGKEPSAALMRSVEAITDAYLGAPPKSFEVDGKTYDPKTYASEFLGLKPADYVEVMSFGTEPLGGKAKLVVPDNWLDYDQYENVPVDQFMAGLNAALDAGYSIALDADVSEKGFKTMKAVATLDDETEKNPALVTQAMRDEAFKNGQTTDDHLMHVVGVAKHEDGRRFYLTKNSWGEKAGPYGGYFFLSEAYVRLKALSFMVHRDALKQKS